MRGCSIKPQDRLLGIVLTVVYTFQVSPCTLVHLLGGHASRQLAHFILGEILSHALLGALVSRIVGHTQIATRTGIVLGGAQSFVQIGGNIQHGSGATLAGTQDIAIVGRRIVTLLLETPAKITACRSIATLGGSTQASHGERKVLLKSIFATQPVVATLGHKGGGEALPLVIPDGAEPLVQSLLGSLMSSVGIHLGQSVTAVEQQWIGLDFVIQQGGQGVGCVGIAMFGRFLQPVARLCLVLSTSMASIKEECVTVHALRIALLGTMAGQFATTPLIAGCFVVMDITSQKAVEITHIRVFAPRLFIQSHGIVIVPSLIQLFGFVIDHLGFHANILATAFQKV